MSWRAPNTIRTAGNQVHPRTLEAGKRDGGSVNYLVVLQNELQSMSREAIAALPSIVIAAAVLLIAWLLARGAAGIARRITGHTQLRGDLRELLQSLIKVGIVLVGILLAATIAIPGFTFGGMVAGLGIGAVAIGFAFQDIFQNFFAGVLIMLRDKMRIGDLIECDKIRGRIEHISLRETHIRQLGGQLSIVPNSLLFKNPVEIVNDQALLRDEIVVPVEFGADIEVARAAVENALKGIPAIDSSRPVTALVRDFDAGAGVLQLLAQWWTDAITNDIKAVRSDALIAILKSLDEAGIALPSSTTHVVMEPPA